MRGKSFGTELKCMCVRVCAYELTHIWMVFECPLSARATSVGEWCRWRARKYWREQQERVREKVGEVGLGGVVGRAAEQSSAEEECRLFPCVERTGELSWLQAGAVSP